ncbi:hypothetical protein [Parafilimonas sp.]|uniref:hypothetical protein n=1 Tax=Parafilimonas sp. TaxID=1969739 RepID=UPI003F81615C
MKFLSLIIIAAFIVINGISCDNEKKDQHQVFFFIDELTQKIDLKNGVYIVERLEGKMEIKFTLSHKEKEAIQERYYSLHLDKIDSFKHFNDKCNIMPKIFTTLNVSRDDQLVQKIEIDESCNDFYMQNCTQAYHIKSFLKFINDILKQKTEIKNAPKSDLLLM